MQLGVIFPQVEMGVDPVAIRDYAQAVEQMGYTHLAVYDHVLGAATTTRPDWRGPYTSASLFHEPLVLFGYLAGCTRDLELVTEVIILPQRQTALVAKQTAEVDILSGGRLRLGVGIGWNDVEYQALGEDFHTRGRRVSEQIAVLRALWTQEVVSFEGKWHRITEAGINPLPVQRPIPIWMGGGRAESALRRIARLADGWFPLGRPDDANQALLESLRGYTKEAGRDPSRMGVQAGINVGTGDPEGWTKTYAAWEALGATHVAANTMGGGFTSPDQHIGALRRFKETVA